MTHQVYCKDTIL